MPNFLFKYPSVLDAADQALDDLLRSLTECGVDTALRRVISVAVSEAFTNAVIHGNGADPAKIAVLRLEVNDQQIIADIIDQGKGGLKQVESRKPSRELDEGGRGVDLIQHYADSCRFEETEDGGLKVTISFRRTKERISAL